MNRMLFHHICSEVVPRNEHFTRKLDALGVMRFHPLHKCVVTVKMLGRGSIVDDTDDKYTMAKSSLGVCQ
jgi:hypothetical protein